MRTILDPENIHSNIKDEVANFQTDIVQEVSKTVAENYVVVVGMRYNPAVSKARDALKNAGIDFVYLEYGSYTSEWQRRLALKMWTGWPTFPMIFVDQKLIGGRKDLLALLSEDKTLGASQWKLHVSRVRNTVKFSNPCRNQNALVATDVWWDF